MTQMKMNDDYTNNQLIPQPLLFGEEKGSEDGESPSILKRGGRG